MPDTKLRRIWIDRSQQDGRVCGISLDKSEVRIGQRVQNDGLARSEGLRALEGLLRPVGLPRGRRSPATST